MTDDAAIEIDVFESEPKKYETKTKPKSQSTTSLTAAATTTTATSTQSTTHRKSVSFDLSDNEYISVVEHDEPEPSMSDDIGELFLKQFSRENSHEENDGYEVPIKYPSGPKSKPTHQVKSILRSPSPNSNASTAPSSLDRPLRTTYLTPNSNLTTAIVHTAQHSSDEEIERENPFRKEFLGQHTKENIYEEVYDDFEESTSSKSIVQTIEIELKDTQKPANYDFPRQRPKSAYDAREYSEIMLTVHQSNDNLTAKTESKLGSQTSSQSTSSLLSDRPKRKPPLPPKPTKSSSSIKPPPPPPVPPVIKHADLKQNEALKTFQGEMLRGDLYEFVHNAETNQITKIKQQMQTIPIAIAKPASEVVVEEKTKETTRLTTFNQSSPLPPIPNSPKSLKSPIPPYSKVLKRPSSVERPTVSPPPPPVNLKTLPGADKLKPLETEDGSRVEILSTSTGDLRKFVRDGRHENAHEYSLVTEETHREILLQENELRNSMQKEQIVSESTVTTSRIPVRKAPQPPTAKQQQQQQHTKNVSISSDVSRDQHSSSSQSTSSAQVFPVTQILPVQYAQLPTPQQPDYFLTFPSSPSPNRNVMAMPQPGAFSTFMVSDNSAPQTTNIPTNIMCHPQQMPMYLQRPYISVPLSTVHSINQSDPYVPAQNFINIHANAASGAQAPVLPSNNNFGHSFDTYRSNYNQQQQLHQHQQQQQHYHYPAQSLLPCQQDTHSSFSHNATVQNNANRNKHQTHDDTSNPNIGSSSFSSMTPVNSQLTNSNRNNENDIPVSSLTSISNSSTNYHSYSEDSTHEQKRTFTTFGKQTQV